MADKPPTMSDAAWEAMQRESKAKAIQENAAKYAAEYKPTQESFLLGGSENYARDFSNRVNTAATNSGYDQNVIGRAAGQASERAQGEAMVARGRANPAATQIAQSAATGGRQGDLASRVQQFAEAPDGPSAAQAQLQKGTNQALASQVALARSGGGLGENAAMMGQAGRNAAGIQAANANNAATLRAEEFARGRDRQLQGYQASGNILGQQRQGTAAEAGMELDAQAQRDQTALGYSAEERANRALSSDTSQRAFDASMGAADLGLKGETLATAGRTAYEQALEEQYLNRMGFDKQRRDERQARKDKKTDTILGVLSGVGSWVKGSDIRGKQNITTLPGGRPRMPMPAGGLAARAAGISAPRPRIPSGALLSDPKTKIKVEDMDSPENEGYDPSKAEVYRPKYNYLRRKEARGELAPGSTDFGSVDANRQDRADRKPSGVKLYRFMSDEDSKKEIDTPDKKGSEYLGVGKYEFEYKDPERHGAGRYRGPMAHELKGIPGVVHESPDGDMVDAGRLSMSNASELGELRREMELLKKKETTELSPEDEERFKEWGRKNRITDLDDPRANYDYRGFWKETDGAPVRYGDEHFPDTYKQHGHETFSNESKYSRDDLDGGRWLGDEFFPLEDQRKALKGPSAVDRAYGRR